MYIFIVVPQIPNSASYTPAESRNNPQALCDGIKHPSTEPHRVCHMS